MMAYEGWLDSHCGNHAKIVDRLLAQGKNRDEIIAYFDYENMLEHEPGFCKLYKAKQKCHDIESLNCYLCACPYFRFNEEGIESHEDAEGDEITLYSRCAIDHKHGGTVRFSSSLYQDCTGCIVPHTAAFVRSVYHEKLAHIMRECNLDTD